MDVDVYEEADLYCAAFSWPLEAEVDWLLGAVPGVRSVLEPFCGNARYGPLFDERGVEYHGIDISQAMLDRAPAGSNLRLHRADVRDLSIPGLSVDLAWCPVNSIRHLTDEKDVVAHLRATRDHLRPGGCYVLELELVRHDGPWTWRPEHGGVWSEPLPDGSVVEARWRRQSCDLARRTSRERATFRRVAGDHVLAETTHEYVMRVWTYDDLLRLTAAAGLAVREAWLHDEEAGFPRVPVSDAAENDGQNRYYRLVSA
jgi:SAM-dependent methyltransferase